MRNFVVYKQMFQVMAKKSLMGLVVWLLVGANGVAQTAVVAADSSAAADNAVLYYLPKTELVVLAEAECTVQQNGPFYKYAERYLGVSDVVTAPTKTWRLKRVCVQAQPVRDEQKCYAVAVNKKTTAYYLQTTDDGVLVAVNAPTPTPDLQPQPTWPVAAEAADTVVTFDMAQLGEEALVASSVPKMAELAAKQIYQIRESRAALLAGDNETLPDGAALGVMLQRLDEAERELVALFVGKSVTYCRSAVYSVVPDKPVERDVLFRMSRFEGIVAADNLIGEPVYLSVTAPKQPTRRRAVGAEAPCGIVYNVPTAAVVELSDCVSVLAHAVVPMPQLGGVDCLPAMLFDGNATRVTLTEYGALKSISR